MFRIYLPLFFLILLPSQIFGQTAGCEYPEEGPYVCKFGDLIRETGHFLKGKKHGEFKYYDFGGKLTRQWYYQHGKQEGEEKTFYQSGELRILRTYKNDIRLTEESFYENGNHRHKKSMDSLGKQGTHYEYRENGKLRKT